MHLSYPAELPISGRKDEIIHTIQQHRVTVIAGDTGSGKTTQIPKMCLEAGRGRRCLIGCTQPRRIAAVSVAERVGEEVRDRLAVGYKIRFHDRTTSRTRIKFMTDGVLLAETRHDRDLKRYDTLIIDEAHERSLNIDFLLGYAKQLLDRRPDLKLVITSATLDTEKFSIHFDDAPVINISGRNYPITIEYIEPVMADLSGPGTPVEQAAAEAAGLVEKTRGGDILLFLPTERDIMDCTSLLGKKLTDKAVVLPLFGRLHARDQRKIFQPSRHRKIIVATNIAETSLTVPGIRFVIDTGLARISRYNVRAGTTSLQVRKISRASCDQRAGRCGRTGPGRCIRLYSEEDYDSRDLFTQPEIQRSNLAEVILQMISLRLGDPRNFPFVDPPSVQSIRDGYRILRELGALTPQLSLTKRGKIMAGLPLDPCISRIIIEAADNGALREIKIIAAGLSIQDPRIRPLKQEAKADERHTRFLDKKSDFLTLLNIWEGYRKMADKMGSKAKLKKYCTTNYLSWQRMREWEDIHDQIGGLLQGKRRFHDNAQPASYASIHQSLLTGLLRNIGRKKEKNIYTINGGRQVMVFPGSSQFNRAGEWIVSAFFMETGRLYAMTVATIDVRWLERIGGELCRRSWSDPHWEKRSGRVIALEKITLFGLIIVAGRKVNYAGTGPRAAEEAREIFLREALVGGKLGGNYPFLRHNLSLIQRIRDLEHRMRRGDLLADEEGMYAFYARRLNAVHDRQGLNHLLQKKGGDRFLWMSEEDIVRTAVDGDELYRFPATLQAGDHAIRLSYCFAPGSEADGITANIPAGLAQCFNPSIFEWLVPGLLEEKILTLLKGLPKQLRRRLVPLPETSARIMDNLALREGSLYAALEKTILRSFQLQLRRLDWQPDKLPPHLKMRFRLIDEGGRTLLTSRDYQDLLQREAPVPDSIAVIGGKDDLPVKTNIRVWDFPDAPAPLPRYDSRNRLAGYLYPELHINRTERAVELRYSPERDQSMLRNRAGLCFLYGLRFPTEVKAVERECQQAVTSYFASWLSLGAEASAAELTEGLKNFLLAEVFGLAVGNLPSAAEFEAAAADAEKRGVVRTCRENLARILELISLRWKVRARIDALAEKSSGGNDPGTALSAELLSHLRELVPPDFLQSRKFRDLLHAGRYLRGLEVRLERAQHSPAKDAKKARLVAPMISRLTSLPDAPGRSTDCLNSLAEYREMVEEFRISVFAPELGTAFPVSAKRLKTKWQEVENNCLRVE